MICESSQCCCVSVCEGLKVEGAGEGSAVVGGVLGEAGGRGEDGFISWLHREMNLTLCTSEWPTVWMETFTSEGYTPKPFTKICQNPSQMVATP